MSNRGIILRSTGSWYTVMDEQKNLVEAKLKGNFKIKGIKSTNPLAVGDIVDFDYQDEKKIGMINKIHPRTNYIIRKSTNLSKQTHIIAANIDMAYIVATVAQPRTSTGFIDRFLVTTEAYHIPVTIIFNKFDLMEEERNQNLLAEYVEMYEAIGYKCILTSAKTGFGIDELKAEIKDKVVLMSGHSGVGKSALINKIDNLINQKTGQISDVHNKGKHTTTFAEMLELSFGGFIIDTPGIKEFGVVDFEHSEVSHYFPEMRELISGCKFNNCTHFHEPHCAIKTAVEAGEIHPDRYNNYLNILNNVEEEPEEWE